MMLAQSREDETPVVLPQVIAEALVQRLTPLEVVERAKAVGLTGNVVDMAVKICGCSRSASGVSAAAK